VIRRVAAAALLLGVLGVLAGCGEEAGPGTDPGIDSGIDSGAVEEPSSSAASSSPSTTPSGPTPSGPTPSGPEPTPTEPTAAQPTAIVGYYLGDGPRGVVLFREERQRVEPDHGPAEAVGMLSARPLDPDYRTYWPPGAFLGAGGDGGSIDIMLAEAMPERPESMSRREAELSIQQVVYTLQAYAGSPTPVRFLLAGEPVDRLLGVPVPGPVGAAPVLETLSTMSLVTPTEGQEVTGSFVASGFNNGFEATAAWQIWRGDEVVLQDATIAKGAYEERLFPWHARIDVSGLAPGTYLLLAANDDPVDDGIDGASDTRTIVVR
jgi:hypothetical protein